MRALVCEQYGPTDELVIRELDDPVAGDGELVVDIAAAGINFPDLLVVAGKYQDKTPPPFVPGNEAAGVVAAVGDGMHSFKPGDKVIVLTRGSAFAEKVVVSEQQAVQLPAKLDFVEAAGFGVVFGTSYHALKQGAELKSGETLLVLGAAGGVGVAAVELAKAMGARVIAAASSEEKLEYARAAGADETINYSEVPLKDSVKALTGGKGVDVVYDPVGGDMAQQALRALTWHGRYLVIGFASGEIPAMPANIVLLKEARIVGVWWGTWVAKHPDEHLQNMTELAHWLDDGTLKPKVTEVFAFDDYKAAFRRISGRQARGKVVLKLQVSAA